MKLVLSLLATGCLFVGGAFAEQINGYVSESMCGAKHSTVSKANTQCVEKCLKGGSAPVLVRNGEVLKFADASQRKAAKHAGQEVKIDGTVNGDTITIKSIKKA